VASTGTSTSRTVILTDGNHVTDVGGIGVFAPILDRTNIEDRSRRGE
jgi:hypothetical protein